MVGAPATQDAVERARALPSLAVGLHVVLVNGRPVLEPQHVPDLVDRNGNFLTELVRAGVRFFFRPGVRNQLASEIRAQFDRFAQSLGIGANSVFVRFVFPTSRSAVRATSRRGER